MQKKIVRRTKRRRITEEAESASFAEEGVEYNEISSDEEEEKQIIRNNDRLMMNNDDEEDEYAWVHRGVLGCSLAML